MPVPCHGSTFQHKLRLRGLHLEIEAMWDLPILIAGLVAMVQFQQLEMDSIECIRFPVTWVWINSIAIR
jgi:hypothetical protein